MLEFEPDLGDDDSGPEKEITVPCDKCGESVRLPIGKYFAPCTNLVNGVPCGIPAARPAPRGIKYIAKECINNCFIWVDQESLFYDCHVCGRMYAIGTSAALVKNGQTIFETFIPRGCTKQALLALKSAKQDLSNVKQRLKRKSQQAYNYEQKAMKADRMKQMAERSLEEKTKEAETLRKKKLFLKKANATAMEWEKNLTDDIDALEKKNTEKDRTIQRLQQENDLLSKEPTTAADMLEEIRKQCKKLTDDRKSLEKTFLDQQVLLSEKDQLLKQYDKLLHDLLLKQVQSDQLHVRKETKDEVGSKDATGTEKDDSYRSRESQSNLAANADIATTSTETSSTTFTPDSSQFRLLKLEHAASLQSQKTEALLAKHKTSGNNEKKEERHKKRRVLLNDEPNEVVDASKRGKID